MNFKTYPLSKKVVDFANESSVELEVGTDIVEVWTLLNDDVSYTCYSSDAVVEAITDIVEQFAE
jgi:hypothetical protein